MDYIRVAQLYDTYVSTTFDIPFFLSEATKAPGEVLELMAGTGRVTIPLAEAGIRLTAVDRSPEMLAILREKLEQPGLAVDVQERDIRHPCRQPGRWQPERLLRYDQRKGEDQPRRGRSDTSPGTLGPCLHQADEGLS